jgi:hypothetical protein
MARHHRKHHRHHDKKHHHNDYQSLLPETLQHNPYVVMAAITIIVLVVVLVTPLAVLLPGSGNSSPPPAVVPAVTDPCGSTVCNDVPRTDATGTVMDVHDGDVLFLNDTFYWFGESYGPCDDDVASVRFLIGLCGFLLNHNASLWTSRDFVNWTPAPTNPVIQFARDVPFVAVFFCPKILFNKATGYWVVWVNYIVNSQFDGGYVALKSTSPFGPFQYVGDTTSSLAHNVNPGDFSLWVDDNGLDAYIIYTTCVTITCGDPGHGVSVEKLAPDYLSALGAGYNSGIFIYQREAPAFFKRNGIYYASVSAFCGFCVEGAVATLFMANCVLGPYVQSINVATPAAGIAAQETDILTFWSESGVQQELWRGDMWNQSFDHEKSHDPTFLGLITFDSYGNAFPIVAESAFNLSIGPKPVNSSTSVGASLFCPWNESSIDAGSGKVYGFETVVIPAGQTSLYSPMITIPSQPWYGTAGSKFGVAMANSTFANQDQTAADGDQFAFLQNSGPGVPTFMYGWVVNVTTPVYVRWYQSVRYQNSNSNSTFTLFVTFNQTNIYVSPPNISSSGGWVQFTSAYSINSSGLLSFSVISPVNLDRSLLLDAISISQ